MPLFLSDEEFVSCRNDGAVVAEKADVFIRDLFAQLDTVKAQADASAITAEQTCSLLDQKYMHLSSELSKLETQNQSLQSSLDQRLSELAQVQAQKHQLHLQSIGKDGEIERLTTEVAELHKSKRQLMDLVEHKDAEISEKNATITSYFDKIVKLTDDAVLREARLNDSEAELARTQAACARLSQGKELLERHNSWLNDELTAKVNSFVELRRTCTEHEADLSAKLADVEKQLSEQSDSLKWHKEILKELETKVTDLQEELCSSKDAAATNEEQYLAEISTINKLLELYKESSEEWSKKAGELEGVVKALETHLNQVESDYKERLVKEAFTKKELEKEAAELREKLQKCEAEVEASRKESESNILPLSSFTKDTRLNLLEADGEDNCMLVPKIPAGLSGTALAASLLRDGWSLAKMYCKYQEAIDALRHEQMGRKSSEEILRRVLYELEEKAEIILDERAEHERMAEAYSALNKKLTDSVSERENMEKTLLGLKAELRRHDRDYALAQKEIVDLQKQVTILLKECRDMQLRCGSAGPGFADDDVAIDIVEMDESDAEKVISERLLSFKDINGLVEQNVQLRSLVRSLGVQVENRDAEWKENFELESKKKADEAASRVAAVLQRAEEQARMIESLHTSVSMYKRLYEEEHKMRSYPQSKEAALENGRKDSMLLFEGSQEVSKRAQEQAAERISRLEKDLAKARSENILLRSEKDKSSLEANFARDRLNSYMKESDHQKDEANKILARNIEFSQMIVDYQRRVRESSESLHSAEELSRKLSMEVSVLKCEKEMILTSEKRALDEVHSLSERVYRLQASLDTVKSAEEVREEAKFTERRKQEEYTQKIEREWAEAKKELQEQRDIVRTLTADREQNVKNTMRHVEEMGKELANALHAAAAAEARAVISEARCSDLEKKMRSSDSQVVDLDDSSESVQLSGKQAVVELHTAKIEVERLGMEAQASKEHMQQYKSIAEVNEAALKQMESAHENYKIEAEKLQKSLEAEILSLKAKLSELETLCKLKSEEAASAAAGKDEALQSALADISSLKEESSGKISQVATLEIQVSALKEDLEKEHQLWRAAQDNYERQVVLQSETIQELTKNSQALVSLQEEASELRKRADALKIENDGLKAKWELEKSTLEESKNKAEKKYNELNEQNLILHSRLEALHIQLAERDRNATGTSGGPHLDVLDDSGLQNVVCYLRRSKEIAETEISLLKQEKLRLQSQLDATLKAMEIAQASLHAERENARASLFTEQEFKSLQLQVREMNLLRESNLQLREENKHNFEECQRLREITQKVRTENDIAERCLREREVEVEALKKEIEMEKMEKNHLEKKVSELLERCKNVDLKEYSNLKEDVQKMQESLRQKDVEVEEFNKLVSEKQNIISKIEQDLVKCRSELDEREKRINEILQYEGSLKMDLDKQKKLAAHIKRKFESASNEKENLLKEKHDLSKENVALSRQLEDLRQGKRLVTDIRDEQAVKEKQERDTRIQILENIVERQREELKKERDELRKERDEHETERVKLMKSEKTIMNTSHCLTQGKMKFIDEYEKLKQAFKKVMEEGEKYKNASVSLPEVASMAQQLSGSCLDDAASAYLLALESFEKTMHSVLGELGSFAPDISAADTSSLAVTTEVPIQAPPSTSSSRSPVKSSAPAAKSTEEKETRSSLPKTNVETRKIGRRLIRPRLGKPEESHCDLEMGEIDGVNKNAPSYHDTDGQLSQGPTTHQPARKRESSSDMAAAPLVKKPKGGESGEGQFSGLENIENLGEASETGGDLLQGSDEEAFDVDTGGGQMAEEPKENQQFDGTGEETLDKSKDEEMEAGEAPRDEMELNIQQPAMDSDKEEGELVPDVTDPEEIVDASNITESPEAGELSELGAMEASPSGVDEETLATTPVDDEGDAGAVPSEDSEKLKEGNDQIDAEVDRTPEASVTVQTTPEASGETEVSKEDGSDAVPPKQEEAKQAPAVTPSSTTINLQERARQRAMLRQQGTLSTSPVRGRGRPTVRGRILRGRGRGRGQSGDPSWS